MWLDVAAITSAGSESRVRMAPVASRLMIRGSCRAWCAHITAWCELRALAALGRRHDAQRAATRAQHHMDAAATDEPGRFGFDHAELHQHLAESALLLGDTPSARTHAEQAIALKPPGSGGWAAATVILARTHAAAHNPADATALASTVLDTVPPTHLHGH